ncbi:hypothetical protein [Glycomyces sp. NPDC047010]|uniref:hypothetical protein n=1 Tax=Glycomyces sp. NPDC047010 TaxID=3155023 RepID=UPI0033E0BF0C
MTSRYQRLALGFAAVAAIIGFSLFASSTPATADEEFAAADTCVRGEFCVYDADGDLVYSNPGNVSGTLGPFPGGGSVRNNGVADPGADHLKYTVTRSDGSSYGQCLHFPGDDTPTTGAIPNNGRVGNFRWVNAC